MDRIRITALDHIVLNVADVGRSLHFYTRVLGLKGERVEAFNEGKVGFPSVRITDETIIDLFPDDAAGAAAADGKRSGNLNHFCMVVEAAEFPEIVNYLARHGIPVRQGPVARWGARGQATSVYFLDPDGNEIEIRSYA